MPCHDRAAVAVGVVKVVAVAGVVVAARVWWCEGGRLVRWHDCHCWCCCCWRQVVLRLQLQLHLLLLYTFFFCCCCVAVVAAVYRTEQLCSRPPQVVGGGVGIGVVASARVLLAIDDDASCGWRAEEEEDIQQQLGCGRWR